MGDLRNKLHKQMRDAAHAEFMAKHYPPPKPCPLPRCACGNLAADVPAMWALSPKMSKIAPGGGLFCPACLPADMFPLIALEVANLPDDA